MNHFRKLVLFTGLLFVGFNSQSQVLITLIFGDKLNTPDLEFGLEGGLNWSRISGMESNSYEPNWNLGFYFDIRVKKQWFFYTGVLVKASLGLNKLTPGDLSFLEATTYNFEGTYSQKINYFIVPTLLKYKFKNRIFIETGPQFGLRSKAWIEHIADEDGFESIFKEWNKESINRIDVGITGGAGYRLSDRLTAWSIGAKYYYGFVNVYKNKSGTNNSAFFLKLNIPIGAGEKAKAKNATKAAEKKEKKAEKALNKKEK